MNKEKIPVYKYGMLLVEDLANQYVIEKIVMGELSPQNEIDLDSCLNEIKEMDLFHDDYKGFKYSGFALKANRLIVRPIMDYYTEFFKRQMEFMFMEMSIPYDEFLTAFSESMKSYLKQLFHLFVDVLETEGNPNSNFRLSDLTDGYSQLVADIKTKALPKGIAVNKYFVGVKNIPQQITALIENRNGYYYLKDNDTDGLPYKFAVLSTISFLKKEHTNKYYLKLHQWAVDNGLFGMT